MFCLVAWFQVGHLFFIVTTPRSTSSLNTSAIWLVSIGNKLLFKSCTLLLVHFALFVVDLKCVHHCFRFFFKLLVYVTINRLSEMLLCVEGTGEYNCLWFVGLVFITVLSFRFSSSFLYSNVSFLRYLFASALDTRVRHRDSLDCHVVTGYSIVIFVICIRFFWYIPLCFIWYVIVVC